jgi:hypothetical protein
MPVIFCGGVITYCYVFTLKASGVFALSSGDVCHIDQRLKLASEAHRLPPSAASTLARSKSVLYHESV